MAATKTSMRLWQKALSRSTEWKGDEGKEEFFDVIYWLRQGLSLFLGLTWGLVPLSGALGLGLFLAINAGIVYLYCTAYQSIDDEAFGGVIELLKEGLFTSFAMFLVVWILTYSAVHF
ncbi:GEL complex subunit OPTI-like [Oscarella lobularis]|uniref:GEL complex subunit OPTI-like n=1 Tax=Oscarella lobularis TaxID=121494 RepID=UPI0033133ADE